MEITTRHLDLYDQMSESKTIFGVSLKTPLKLPCMIVTTEKEITSMIPLSLIKQHLKLGNGGDTSYLKINDKLVELGTAKVNVKFWRTIKKVLGEYDPYIYELNEELVLSQFDEDRVAELLFED